MKFQNMVRMQVMLMGLGAALLLASSAHAQQDMDPTDFPVNPGTPQSVKVNVARTMPAAAKEASYEAMVPVSLWSNQDTKQEADLNRMAIVDGTMGGPRQNANGGWNFPRRVLPIGQRLAPQPSELNDVSSA
jgi:hypothetical protein